MKERSPRDVETRSGVTMGTIGFMPPEQARGLTSEIDARSDVWAVGATFYTLLSGRSLHEAATANESLLLAMTKPAPTMRDALPSVPRAVQSVIDRALSFERGLRYANARDMRAALEAATRGTVDPRAPAPSSASSPSGTRRFVLASVSLAGAAAVAVFAWRSLAGHPERPAGLVSQAPEVASLPPPESIPIASSAPVASSAPTTPLRPRSSPSKAPATPAPSSAAEPPDPLGPRH